MEKQITATEVLGAVLPESFPVKELLTTTPGISMEDIVKRPLSYSSLKEFMRSPKHFLHYRNAPKDKEVTYALIFGGLVDCLVLTPDEYDQRYIILNAPEKCFPEKVLLKDVGKEKFEAYKVELANAEEAYKAKCAEYDKIVSDNTKVIITQKMYDEACTLRDVIFKHPVAMKVIERVTKVQCEYTWKDKATGLSILGKFDGEGDDMIFELKTAINADPEEFMKAAFNFKYHIQCATYLEAMAKKGKYPQFVYIVIEKTAPYGISVLQPTKEYVELGKQELRKLLDTFAFCLKENKWEEGYEFKSSRIDKTFALDLPPWAKRLLNND